MPPVVTKMWMKVARKNVEIDTVHCTAQDHTDYMGGMQATADPAQWAVMVAVMVAVAKVVSMKHGHLINNSVSKSLRCGPSNCWKLKKHQKLN